MWIWILIISIIILSVIGYIVYQNNRPLCRQSGTIPTCKWYEYKDDICVTDNSCGDAAMKEDCRRMGVSVGKGKCLLTIDKNPNTHIKSAKETDGPCFTHAPKKCKWQYYHKNFTSKCYTAECNEEDAKKDCGKEISNSSSGFSCDFGSNITNITRPMMV
jgi:hypothetical protein